MFPTTRWTLILAAREDEGARRAALETLLATYWRPAYVFLRRKGLAPEDAEDAVQGFFLRFLEGDALSRLDPSRGRFRSYLLTALERHVINLHERESAVKRGGRVNVVPIEALDAERDLPAIPEDPASAFDREWALSLMERATTRLAREYEEGRRKGSAEAVLHFFRLDEAPSYADAARACGMTVTQFKAALHRARERFRAILREEVADTLAEDTSVESELKALFLALAG